MTSNPTAPVMRLYSTLTFHKTLCLYSVLFFVAVLACYYSLFAMLVDAWANNAVYSHGFLVPFISAYLIWSRRDTLLSMPPSPAYAPGIIVLAIGLLLLISGKVGGVLVAQELSLIITLAAIVLLVLGFRFFTVLFFPIIYLVFMLTSWGIITESLHMPFQLFTANLGAKMIQAVGIPTYRVSNYIELPNITLEVAKICSGVNYLIAVAAIGIPLAYISIISWSRRIILVLAALVMAVLANSLRVAMIGVLAYYNLSGDLHGPMHTLHAMFVSVIGYIILFVGVYFLSEKKVSRSGAGASGENLQTNGAVTSPSLKLPVTLCVILLLATGGVVNSYSITPAHAKQRLAEFPARLGQWNMVVGGTLSSNTPELRADDVLIRTYENSTGDRVTLYVGYLEMQEQGKEIVNDDTAALHEGSTGLDIYPGGDRSTPTVRINMHTATKGGGSNILFWYQLNGRVIDDRVSALAYTAWNGLLRGRTNGALIVLEYYGQGNADNAADFASALLPVLNQFI